MLADQNRAVLIDKVRDEGKRILEYWRNQVLLPDGDFHGEITHVGEVRPDADRGIILAVRILWTFSKAITSGFQSTAEYRDIVDRSYGYLRKRFWDPVNLGFYWLLDKDHHPVNDRKHIYAQAFAVYGLAEYYAASGNEEALATAQLTYTLIETYAADKEFNGYFESFTKSWETDNDLRLSPQDMNEAKSMNTHLHILEAYTRLYEVWPNSGLRGRIQNLLDIIKMYILDNETYHYLLFFESDWKVKSDVISYGHDIEGSWLMVEAAEAIHDAARIEEFKALAVRMVDVVLAEGVDNDYGIMNEGRGNQVIDDEKHWWPQAEAVVGCVNAFQITGDEKYLNTALNIWSFIEKFIRDDEHGEWFWKVSKTGEPDASKPIVEPWKCPYHNTRACVEVWSRLSNLKEGKRA